MLATLTWFDRTTKFRKQAKLGYGYHFQESVMPLTLTMGHQSPKFLFSLHTFVQFDLDVRHVCSSKPCYTAL